ncbi:MAG: 50S ribosomal protein L7ae [Gemmatimonadetes bacterium]|nr:50S ribosomal protein L7ae [Gemmatimonadota bacterium]
MDSQVDGPGRASGGVKDASRALNLLGLAARAGSVLPGTERVREAARTGNLALALLARDASDNSRGKLLPLLQARRIPFLIAIERVRLGGAVGRSPLRAVGITDPALARQLEQLLAGVGCG